MPESMQDRPTRSHEYVFLLSKRERYFYDGEAVREEAIAGWNGSSFTSAYDIATKPNLGQSARLEKPGRNARTVWRIPAEGFAGAHFATFPSALATRCILAGTSAHGVCRACGAPWRREVDIQYHNPGNRTTNGPRSLENRYQTAGFPLRLEKQIATTGWAPNCRCFYGPGFADPVPALVLDPFCGSGTTLLAARALGRHGVGLDLSWPYLSTIARARLELTALAAWEGRNGSVPTTIYADLPLFAELHERGETDDRPRGAHAPEAVVLDGSESSESITSQRSVP
jgi:hypothetical protein